MLTRELRETLTAAVREAADRRHEYITLEHLLLAILSDRRGAEVLTGSGADIDELRSAMAVLPTPGSPTSIGLFFRLRQSTCTTRSSSPVRPISSSILPAAARATRFEV